ncbi:MAG: hypothetical protein H7831_00545 [Magnetococcus sp. WYHC-3]
MDDADASVWDEDTLARRVDPAMLPGLRREAAERFRQRLRVRFGELPAWVGQYTDRACRATLHMWSQRLQGARCLEEVFAPH